MDNQENSAQLSSVEKFAYKYLLDAQVVTPFGAPGVVTMLGYDDGGRKYYVQTEKNSDWFKEDQLRGYSSGDPAIGIKFDDGAKVYYADCHIDGEEIKTTCGVGWSSNDGNGIAVGWNGTARSLEKFIKVRCSRYPSARIGVLDLYIAYVNFCADCCSKVTPFALQDFVGRLRDRGVVTVFTPGKQLFVGINLDR